MGGALAVPRGGSPVRADGLSVRIVALDASVDASVAGAWQELFEASGSTCFCRYWHFTGKKSDWLERCFQRPEENRDEQLALVRGGALEARGLVAMDGPTAVGWMKLAPRALLPKLRQQGAYRPLDLGPDEGVWSIGCFLVRPDRRREGVARALVMAASEHLRAWNGPGTPALALEAYPRGTTPEASLILHDEEAWVGTQHLFETCGFTRVAGEPAYPVMRRVL
jgi:GNAT superfamily N-acetyltransferase